MKYGKLTEPNQLYHVCRQNATKKLSAGRKAVARKAPQNARGCFAAFCARARRSDRAPCGALRLCAPKSAAKRAFGGVIALFDSPLAPPPFPLPLPRWGLGRGSNCAFGASRRLRVAFSARPRARKCATLTGGNGGAAWRLAARPRRAAAAKRAPFQQRAPRNSSGNKPPRRWGVRVTKIHTYLCKKMSQNCYFAALFS